jgi:hypothetical protein
MRTVLVFRQSEATPVVWGCGHTDAVYLSLDALQAAEQLVAYHQIDCIACAKAKRLPTRGITWSDLRWITGARWRLRTTMHAAARRRGELAAGRSGARVGCGEFRISRSPLRV